MREVLFSLREAHSLKAKMHRESAKHLDNKHLKKNQIQNTDTQVLVKNNVSQDRYFSIQGTQSFIADF